MKRIFQKEIGFCGPASLQILFSFYGLVVPQELIVEKTNVADTETHIGFRLDTLNDAVKKINHNFVILAKYNSTISDLKRIIDVTNTPLGVEWQGKFKSIEGIFYSEGHYSVVTSIENSEILIIDPEPHSTLLNGRISFEEFQFRWYEYNQFPESNLENINIRTENLIFVLANQSNRANFLEFGFGEATVKYILEHSIDESV
jgi:hypothetical protein